MLSCRRGTTGGTVFRQTSIKLTTCLSASLRLSQESTINSGSIGNRPIYVASAGVKQIGRTNDSAAYAEEGLPDEKYS